jgi:16S rRNA processing protein RimM
VYYYQDLRGCRVETVTGEEVGRVEAVIRLVSQDLLIVNGGKRGEVFIPFVPPIIQDVDIEGNIIMIDPPDGLLNLNTGRC